jgi:hypothetical protein
MSCVTQGPRGQTETKGVITGLVETLRSIGSRHRGGPWRRRECRRELEKRGRRTPTSASEVQICKESRGGDGDGEAELKEWLRGCLAPDTSGLRRMGREEELGR